MYQYSKRLGQLFCFVWWKVSTCQHAHAHLCPLLLHKHHELWFRHTVFFFFCFMNDRFMENTNGFSFDVLSKAEFTVRHPPRCSCQLVPTWLLGKHLYWGVLFFFLPFFKKKFFLVLLTGMQKKYSEKRSWAVSWSVSVIRPSDTYCLISEYWFSLTNVLQRELIWL